MTETQRLDATIEELVPLAQRGDEAAFEGLVKEAYQQIYRWALSYTGNGDDADDVTQEVLVRLHQRLSSFSGRSRFTTWLYRVTRNVALEMARRRARRARKREAEAELAPADRTEPGWETPDASAMSQAVRRVFEGLPPGQRRVFDLADLQGYAPVEIAEMLGMKPVTVRAHLSKARRAIRRKILEQHPQLVEDRLS